MFKIYKENNHTIIKIFGIKLTLKRPVINPIEDLCFIPDLEKLLKNNTRFPHPIGIVITKSAKIGKDCVIFQNTTIGDGKYNEKSDTFAPVIGNNVVIYANCNIIGGIKIGNNVTIGAGSVVVDDFEDNVIIAGNPAKVIRKK